jgi:putative transposase
MRICDGYSQRRVGVCYRVCGVADHVHLAIRRSRTSNVSDLVKEIKSSSSKWLKTKSQGLAKFEWQKGYGAFSVGPKDLNALIAYIDAQQVHHAKQSFQDEFRAFLRQYGVEFDERYLWD